MCSIASAKPKKAQGPVIKALLITGGCCHDYNEQREVIPMSIDLHSKQKVEWTILHQRTSNGSFEMDFYKNPDWAKGYDVVVHNECFANIGSPEYLESILKPHRDGVPAVQWFTAPCIATALGRPKKSGSIFAVCIHPVMARSILSRFRSLRLSTKS